MKRFYSIGSSRILNGRFKLVRMTHPLNNANKQVYLESLEPAVAVEEGFKDDSEKRLYPHLCYITINRPEVKNALGREMMQELNRCIDAISTPESRSNSARVVIVRSAISKVFCAGADLRERIKMSNEEVQSFVTYLRESFDRVARIPVPTIAVLHGAALGGGLELALACDLRISGSRAKLGLPETGLAIIPGAGGTQRLPRLIGPARAKELIFTGRLVTGLEAEKIGLVTQNVSATPGPDEKDPDAEALAVLNRATSLAFTMANRGPVGMRMAKKAIDLAMPVSDLLGTEGVCYDQTIPTEDRMEGLKSFIEGRSPIYQGK